MRGTTLQQGTIIPYTYPVDETRDMFKACCEEDYSVNIFIRHPLELNPVMRRVIDARNRCFDATAGPYTPCVVDQRMHNELSYHSAWLLSPPNIGISSNLFVPGLAVPDLRLHRVLEREGRLAGYVLRSDYLGRQEFFLLPTDPIEQTLLTRYIGVITQVPRNPKHRPVVRLKVSSRGNASLFWGNANRLEDMLGASSVQFWWNLKA